ncbi:MAG: bleomycin resistance protein [Variovorax sp.]|nr:MAG: bleomycin resistance protein [Variovorax sp.]
MPPDLRLGYLVFEARRTARWAGFCEQMLGLPAPVANADGSRGWQVDDDAAQRLIVQEGPADDLAALGLECADLAVLEGRMQRLREGGFEVAQADAALRDARRVKHLYRCIDPAGNAVELFTGLAPAARPFASAAFPEGFRTGELGLGHAVLVSRDLEAMEAFYALLGFGVTERLATRAGPLDIRGIFLHCNRRHHSIAVFDMPISKRIHHFMLQAHRHCDIGIAFERAQRHKVPLSLELGQHPDPDGTFSFYGVTPSGFDFEIGAGTQTIDPAGWNVQHTGVTSAWGHKPKLRLQLKMAAGLIAQKFARTPRRAKELA